MWIVRFMALSGTCTLFLNALALYLRVYFQKRGTSALQLLPATLEILPFLSFIIYSFGLVSRLCSAPKAISTWRPKCMLGFSKQFESFINIKTKSKACLSCDVTDALVFVIVLLKNYGQLCSYGVLDMVVITMLFFQSIIIKPLSVCLIYRHTQTHRESPPALEKRQLHKNFSKAIWPEFSDLTKQFLSASYWLLDI